MKNTFQIPRNKALPGILILAGIAILAIAVSDRDDDESNQYTSPMPVGIPLAQGNPLKMMFMPLPQGWDATLVPNDNQTPRGWHGVRPVGRMPDGRPIYNQMPVYDEVPQAFVANVYYPGPDYRMPGMVHQVSVPAKGRARNTFRKKIEDDFRKCYAAQSAYEMSSEKRAEDIRNEISKMEWESRAQSIRYEAHEHQLAHINNMTRDQYLKAQEKGLKRINNGIPHTDRFIDEQGNIWKVDVHGNAYKLSELGNWIKERE